METESKTVEAAAERPDPFKAPQWTRRMTHQEIREEPITARLDFRKPGWYEMGGSGIALFSDPRTPEGGSETVRVSIWAADPRAALADAITDETKAVPMDPRFVAVWPQLVALSSKVIDKVVAVRRSEGFDVTDLVLNSVPLPTKPPISARACNEPMSGEGHMHVENFQVLFIPLDAEQLEEYSKKPDLTAFEEVLFAEDGVFSVVWDD